MTRKEKGFHYIDSHSGAGMYQLADEFAQKTGEYKGGIAKLINEKNLPEALQPYIDLIREFNPNSDTSDLDLYPGSPAIAKRFMRRQDSTHLFELHSTDIQHLTDFGYRWKKLFIKQSDGYQGVLGLLPPPSRRGVVLIDPPYELKEDYQKAVSTIIKAYKKFATGTYILWYPVVKRSLVNEMKSDFINSDVKNLLQVEFCLSDDTDEYGMTGTGLFIVNSPWQLAEQMIETLPYLKEKLGNNDSSFTVTQLIKE
jgi:23S rRNA (adenine2030-N6)-methyltransferase